MRRRIRSHSRAISWLGLLAAWTSVAASAALADPPATLEVDVSKPGVPIPPEFYGLMTEEINHSYDGGLFAELIQNRTFQDPATAGHGGTRSPVHWSVVGAGNAVDRRN